MTYVPIKTHSKDYNPHTQLRAEIIEDSIPLMQRQVNSMESVIEKLYFLAESFHIKTNSEYSGIIFENASRIYGSLTYMQEQLIPDLLMQLSPQELEKKHSYAFCADSEKGINNFYENSSTALAHYLRNPLFSIAGFTNSLNRNPQTKSELTQAILECSGELEKRIIEILEDFRFATMSVNIKTIN